MELGPGWEWGAFALETFRDLVITVIAFALAVKLAFRIARQEQKLQRDEQFSGAMLELLEVFRDAASFMRQEARRVNRDLSIGFGPDRVAEDTFVTYRQLAERTSRLMFRFPRTYVDEECSWLLEELWPYHVFLTDHKLMSDEMEDEAVLISKPIADRVTAKSHEIAARVEINASRK